LLNGNVIVNDKKARGKRWDIDQGDTSDSVIGGRMWRRPGATTGTQSAKATLPFRRVDERENGAFSGKGFRNRRWTFVRGSPDELLRG
jgi:hypothetical protein